MLSLGLKHISHLKMIGEHNTVCKLIEELNENLKIILFLLYFLASPALMVLLANTHSKNTIVVAKFVSLFIFIIVFGVVIYLNISSSPVSSGARKPLKYLYRFMAENRLKRMERLKTMLFIERLSGPDIGFYCLDLFPMNSYEFTIYIINCMKSYLLIISLIPNPDLI